MSVKNMGYFNDIGMLIFRWAELRAAESRSRFGCSAIFLGLFLSVFCCAGCGDSYQLSSYHANLGCDGGACHQQSGVKPTAKVCAGCHPDVATRIAGRRGLHGEPNVLTRKSCAEAGTPCHYEHRDGLLLPPDFAGELRRPGRHGEVSGFALEGVHAQVGCQRCHRPAASGRTTYLTATPACASCHRSPHGSVGAGNADCVQCHRAGPEGRSASGRSTTTPPAGKGLWLRRSDSEFDHNRNTRFRIDGTMHEAVPCTGRCHGKPPVFSQPLSSFADCTPCHKNVHGGSFGARACRTCHSEKRSFSEPRPFDHRRDTDWPLDGPHQDVSCLSCHPSTGSRPPNPDCGTCHRDQSPHRGRFVLPDRSGRPSSKPMPCATCHALPTWQTAAFDHRTQTGFALHASHRVGSLYDCRQCHRGLGGADFQNLSSLLRGPATANNRNIDCVGCHRHRDAENSPAHARFPRDWFRAQGCVERCHESDGDASLKRCRTPRGDADPACLGKLTGLGHGESNPFKLIGGHDLSRIRDKCRTCHVDKQSRFTQSEMGRARLRSDCASCHSAVSPHAASFAERGSGCERCHDPATGTFKNVRRFDHQRGSGFPLLGRHATVPCTSRCHPASLDLAHRFRPRPQTCSDRACHGEADIHKGRNGTACERCHSPTHPDGFRPPVEIKTVTR